MLHSISLFGLPFPPYWILRGSNPATTQDRRRQGVGLSYEHYVNIEVGGLLAIYG